MREKELIKKSYITILYYCSLIAMVEGSLLLIPLLGLPFFKGEGYAASWFIIPAVISMAAGAAIYFGLRRIEKVSVSLNHSAIIVVFAWLFGCLLGGVPFALSGKFTYLHGLFESVSGWTTTGLTVVNTDQVPNLLLLWRSIMQYIGGAGFAVIMLSILSGPSASGIYQSEGHQDEILPQVKQSTKMVVRIYLIYLALGIVGYMAAGMNLFDAINHCMTALATGGFSTKNASIGYYNSVPIEVVTIVLMLIGHINFATHHYIFQKKWNVVKNNAELHSSAILLLFFVPVTLFFVTMPIYNSLGEGLRKAAFESVSALTGTGFSTVDYTTWNALGIFIIIILMCAGGHTNSTSGGIKQMRLYLIGRSLYWMIRDQFIPPSAVTSDYYYKGENRIFVKPQHIKDLFNYVSFYIITFLVGSGVLMALNIKYADGTIAGMKDCLFEFASALGTVGLTFGITSYNSPPAVLWTEIIGMFLGRLEFFVIFYCIIKIIRDVTVLASKEK